MILRKKARTSCQDEPISQYSQIKDTENNLLSSINSLKDEILNLKEFVFENLQNENEKHQQK